MKTSQKSLPSGAMWNMVHFVDRGWTCLLRSLAALQHNEVCSEVPLLAFWEGKDTGQVKPCLPHWELSLLCQPLLVKNGMLE